MRKFTGFTLSEVLLTLGIIGAIAAIIMPIIVKNYKKQYVENRLKSAYSLFSQAINQAKAEHGDFINWDTALSRDEANNLYLKPYLKIIKGNKVVGKDLKTSNSNSTASYSYLFSQTYYGPTYYLSNGMRYTILFSGGTLHVTVDINGDKGPNKMGYDGFDFIIDKDNNQLVPECNNRTDEYLTKYSNYSHACTIGEGTSNVGPYMGGCCAEVIRRNNWKIPKDYPINL